MITESMVIQGFHAIALSLTPEEKWSSAASYRPNSATVALFAVFGIVSLCIVVALSFRAFAKKKRAQQALELKASELGAEEEDLLQENQDSVAKSEQPAPQETVEVS